MARRILLARRLKRLRYLVYRFFEQPRGWENAYHAAVFFIIIVSFTASVLLTIPSLKDEPKLLDAVARFELFILLIFSTECGLRIWSCGSVSKYQGLAGKVRFIRSFYMIVDIVLIGTTIGVVIHYHAHGAQTKLEITMTQIAGFVQIFRIVRIDRQRGDFKKIGRLVFRHKKELLASYFIGCMVLIFSVFAVYILENSYGGEDKLITNLADGLYWGIITVAMVGYGDLSPKFWASKLVTCVFALFGSALFAIPIGIISSGFALEVAKEKRQQQRKQIETAAARLIQRWWKASRVVRNVSQQSGITTAAMKADLSLFNRIFVYQHVPRSDPDKISLQSLSSSEEQTSSTNSVIVGRTQQIALGFYYYLREIAALKKFHRARKPFIQLEDVISQISSTRIQLLVRVNEMEVRVARKNEVLEKLDSVLSKFAELERAASNLIYEPDEACLVADGASQVTPSVPEYKRELIQVND